MPATETEDVLARWAAHQERHRFAEGVDACTAVLQALEVARVDLRVGSGAAEETIRRIAGHFRHVGRRSGLIAFEAWGIQLETAPAESLADQVEAAVTGLRRVLALPRRPSARGSRCILLLEPDANEARRLEATLSAPGRAIVVTRTGEEARTVCRTEMVDVVVVDIEAVPAGGRQLLLEIRERMDRTCTVVLTPDDDPSLQAEAFALGADLCFSRPVHAQVVATAVAGQLDRMSRAADAAVRDGLTGLVNRTGFEEAHRRARADAARYGEPLSLAILDLDRFKQVNDRFGHPTGDRVLLGVATVLEERFREGDLVARWGGEEFAVLLPRTAPPGAVEAVEAVRAELAGRTFLAAGGVPLPPVSFSAGVADARRRLDVSMAEADRRLYVAKRRGRNGVEGPSAH